MVVYSESHLSGKWHFDRYGHHLCQKAAVKGDHKGSGIVVGEHKSHLLVE